MASANRKATPSQGESLQRLAALAGLFMSSRTPLKSSEVYAHVYPDYDDPDSAETRFREDRGHFAARGFVIEQAGNRDGELLWHVADGTFAGSVELDPDELLVLAGAARTLLQDSSFPFTDDLRSALAKVSGSFDQVLPSSALAGEREELGEAARVVTRALSSHRGVEVTYVNAKGERSERRLACWGAYPLRGQTYVVAARLEDAGEPEPELRRYRLDRFEEAHLLDEEFEVPEDFYVEDMELLPFQIGDEDFEFEAAVPAQRVAELRNLVRDRARVRESQGSARLVARACSTRAAAAWAIDLGLTPVSPEPVVGEWRRLLEEVAR